MRCSPRLGLLSLLAATALALAALASPRAVAEPPSLESPDRARADLALAFGLSPGEVVEARAFDRPGTTAPAFVLGRYRAKDGDWTFPGLAAYVPCKGGLCVVRVYLGAAATRLAPLALVDLDATTTSVPLSPRWNTLTLPTAAGEPLPGAPGTRADDEPRWPAVAVAIDRTAPDQTTVDLVLVSLRADAPAVLLELPLEQRGPDATEAEMRGPDPRPSYAPVGDRLEALVLAHTAGVHRATATVRPIDSRWSGCLRTEAYPVVYELPEGRSQRFAPRPDNPPPTRPCH